MDGGKGLETEVELSWIRVSAYVTRMSGMCGRSNELSMASELVRCALSTVLEDKDLEVNSSRIDSLKELGTNILERVTRGEAEKTAFDKFSTELTTLLRGTFHPSATNRSSAAKREKLWSVFHQLRLSELPKLWDDFLSLIEIRTSDQLLQQSVNQKVFEMLLPGQFSSPSPSHQRPDVQDSPLSKDELKRPAVCLWVRSSRSAQARGMERNLTISLSVWGIWQ